MPGPRVENTYLVEHYRPGLAAAELEQCLAGVRDLVRAPGGAGAPLQVVCSVIVPADEAFLVLFRARSEAHVREAYLRAGLTLDRLSLALAGDGGGTAT